MISRLIIKDFYILTLKMSTTKIKSFKIIKFFSNWLDFEMFAFQYLKEKKTIILFLLAYISYRSYFIKNIRILFFIFKICFFNIKLEIMNVTKMLGPFIGNTFLLYDTTLNCICSSTYCIREYCAAFAIIQLSDNDNFASNFKINTAPIGQINEFFNVRKKTLLFAQ